MELPNPAELVSLDDSALIAWRRQARAELDHAPGAALQSAYDATTREMAARACPRPTGGAA